MDLRNRALGAVGQDAVIDDPLAVEAYRRLDDDGARFGRPSQSHALRAAAIDREIRDHLRAHPDATVVALGEGLQTTFWRIADPRIRWVSVDLAPITALRAQLFPDEPRVTTLTMSATDHAWANAVTGPPESVFVVAEGLLMYLDRDDVLALVAECARRFPGGRMMFDSIPHWFSRRTLAGLRLSPGYTAPPMPTAFTVGEIPEVFGRLPGVADVQDVLLPPGRGLWKSPLFRWLARVRLLRNIRPSITLLRFDGV